MFVIKTIGADFRELLGVIYSLFDKLDHLALNIIFQLIANCLA
jgi:hypothetical protein